MQCKTTAHRAYDRMIPVMRAMLCVAGAQSIGNQDVNRLAEQLLAFIPEQFFGDQIEQQNAAFAIYFNDGVGSGLQYLAKTSHPGTRLFLLRLHLQELLLNLRELLLHSAVLADFREN
jgi:hypothetical protein